MAFYIKQNDTAPALRVILKDGDDEAIDLEDATIRFHMRSIGSTTVKVDSIAPAILPYANGIVQYDWSASDTDTAGSYHGEFEVTYADGSIETFPNNGYIRIQVTDDIT